MKPTANMYIHLKGLKLYAYHGVLPQENQVGAEYTIDLRLKTDFTQAAETDRLEGTVNYAEVFNAVKKEMEIPSQLLEHVAWRIARRLLDDFPTISKVDIALYKQNPPMGADCSRVGVEVTYLR
ncbi:dihydroneopterin aldolase [Bacteroides sp. CAG:443]|nr:dihydroneopterin aldolase [Bacteroides sp. CAG:443]